MNTSSKVITTQPIISYLDKTSKNRDICPHKNSCEKCFTCNSTADRYPIDCDEFSDMFKLYEDRGNGGKKKFGLYSCCCFPITLPFITLCCGPCALYNICRNACNDTKKDNNTKKNYLC